MRSLGELEKVIMDRLWAAERPMTVREVYEDLLPERSNAYTTVLTVMVNLHRKGWLRREMRGRAYLYEPLQSREVYSAELMREVLSESMNRSATLLHFLGQLPASEAAALREALSSEAAAPRRRPRRGDRS